MQIILIAGKSGSGKTTMGNLILKKLKAQNKKALMTEYSKYLKMYAKEIFNYEESEEKPRAFLQNTGSFLRSYDANVFINRMLTDLLVYEKYVDYVIISDVRLKREITFILDKYPNTLTIKMINEKSSNLSNTEKKHITETELEFDDDFDYIIKNKNNNELEEIANQIVEERL